MKKVSKRVKSIKLNDGKYTSLNGSKLKKIKGGEQTERATTDRLCGGGCGATASW